MKTFNYHSTKDVKEATKLASSSSAFLAGGMTTLPSMKLGLASYKDIIDIKRIKKLSGIKASGKSVTIGSTTKHAEVANSKEVKKAIPSLAALAEGIGDPQVRNRGTIGGSIANNDPSADYPAALLSLNAKIYTSERTIDVEDFFIGLFETALNEGEIVTKISFPICEKASYKKFPNPASGYAVVGAFLSMKNDIIRVAITGAGPKVFRIKQMEEKLSKSFSTDSIKDIVVSHDDLNSDLHASSEYRSHLINVMVNRAVLELT